MTESDDTSQTSAARIADEWMASLRGREAELREQGHSRVVAFETAQVEDRIRTQWPAAWEDDLQVLIYGDFDAPPAELNYPLLGIRVLPENLPNTVISGAFGVLAARVRIRERSFAAVMDAGARVNTLIGIWAVAEWGNRPIDWWSHITHGGMSGTGGPIDVSRVDSAIEVLEHLRPDVRRKVRAAMYWIREPRQMMQQSYKHDGFRMFSGYWNAFECLVEAVCLVVPKPRSSRPEKDAAIAAFVSGHGGVLNVVSVIELYRTCVDDGFVGKASHALRTCFPEDAERYIDECFLRLPKERRLYAIRNAIDHGDIDADNLQEMMQVEGRHRQLWMIVFRMLGKFIPFGAPADSSGRVRDE
jgi:hypothetical protein